VLVVLELSRQSSQGVCPWNSPKLVQASGEEVRSVFLQRPESGAAAAAPPLVTETSRATAPPGYLPAGSLRRRGARPVAGEEQPTGGSAQRDPEQVELARRSVVAHRHLKIQVPAERHRRLRVRYVRHVRLAQERGRTVHRLVQRQRGGGGRQPKTPSGRPDRTSNRRITRSWHSDREGAFLFFSSSMAGVCAP
jgi:hypothetical protein